MDVDMIYTHSGLNLLSKTALGHALSITRIAAGAGHDDNIESLTELTDLRQELTITGSIRRGTQSIIYAYLSNKDLKTGYDLTQIGIYANDPDAGEILYRVAQLKRSFPISAEEDFPNFVIDCTFTDTVSNASQVNVVVDPSGMVTAVQFAEAVDRLKAENIELTAAVEGLKDEIAKIAGESGNAGKRVIAARTRDPSKPSYGLGSDTVPVTLTTGAYTEDTEVGIYVDGVSYSVNMSTDGENAPDGTMIIKKS